MLIVRGNIRCKVSQATSEEKAWIQDYLSLPDKSWQARRSGEDAKVQLVSMIDSTFPAGFLPLVQKAAVGVGIQIDVLDKRQKPCDPDLTADLEWLRHHPAVTEPITYQVEAVEACGRHQRGIIDAATGSGKGEMIIGLWKYLPCRWLFVVNSAGLVNQQAERFEKRTGVKAGVIGDGVWAPQLGPRGFTFATFQSLDAAVKRGDQAALDLLQSVQGLAVDECHTLPSASYIAIANRTINAFYRIGFSGTPLARGDAKSIWAIGTLGPVIYKVKASTLIALGAIADPTIRMYPCEQFSSSSDGALFSHIYQELVVQSKLRNDLVCQIAAAAAKPGILFVKSLQHGKALQKRLERAGIASEFVHGAKDQAHRRAILERLRRRDIDIAIASKVWITGLDFPELASVILAKGGASVIEALQAVGRGTRATATKSTVEVYDIADAGEASLTRHARTRRNAYIKAGYRVIEGADNNWKKAA